MTTRRPPARKSYSRTQKRYMKKAVVAQPHPISTVGAGQGGILAPSGNAGSAWG